MAWTSSCLTHAKCFPNGLPIIALRVSTGQVIPVLYTMDGHDCRPHNTCFVVSQVYSDPLQNLALAGITGFAKSVIGVQLASANTL